MVRRSRRLDSRANRFDHIAILQNINFLNFERSLDRVGLIVDPFNFLQRPALRLNTVQRKEVSAAGSHSPVVEGKGVGQH